ncbi:MAG: hypothetical protein M5E90_03195 [Asgard group archaeon]|nr:hypothetical protein [Asgard group archaeon]
MLRWESGLDCISYDFRLRFIFSSNLSTKRASKTLTPEVKLDKIFIIAILIILQVS